MAVGKSPYLSVVGPLSIKEDAAFQIFLQPSNPRSGLAYDQPAWPSSTREPRKRPWGHDDDLIPTLAL
jgi:hypothetical protein